LTGKSDPYCVIKFKKGLVGSLLHKDKLMTRVVERNCNPIWNEEFVLHPHNPDLDIIQIQVYDKDRIGADTFLGKVNLPVAQYWKRGLIDEWIPLSSKRKLNKPAFGELHILACYSDSGMGAGMGGGYGGQQMVGSGTGMGQSSLYGGGYGQPGYGSSGYGTSGLSSGYGQSGLTSSSGYGTSGLSSGYGQSGLSSGYGTGYGTSSGLGYGQSGLTSSSGYGSSGLSSGYGTQQRGISSSGVPSSSLMSSSGYGNIPSSTSTSGYGQTSGISPASKEFSSGSYGIPYGSSHMNMMPGYGASHLGLTGSNVGSMGGGFVNYPPPVARHQDKW
jgi:hypothetical protein